jgi:hypothetical protein
VDRGFAGGPVAGAETNRTDRRRRSSARGLGVLRLVCSRFLVVGQRHPEANADIRAALQGLANSVCTNSERPCGYAG